MSPQTPLQRFESLLKSRKSAAQKAAGIIQLAPRLPSAAIAVMDRYLDAAAPLVKVAIMDAYFEMTDDDYHEEDLVTILDAARRQKDKGEELYMAARFALSRIYSRPGVRADPWGIGKLEMTGIKTRVTRRGVRRRARAVVVDTLTIIIHGTWAADGEWWRPRGDFFEYVKKDLQRQDLYGKADQFKWSGKNKESSRQKASKTLGKWIGKHPATEVNVFAHSHGANVAMLATKQGVKFQNLVMLSPPVRPDYFPRWANIKNAFNIQADFDIVVALARGGQWFKEHGITKVKEKKLKADGHSSSHDPSVWRKEKLAKFVGMPW